MFVIRFNQKFVYRLFSVIVSICFLLNMAAPYSYGESKPEEESFEPVTLRGINLYPEHPLKFDFIVDRGDQNVPVYDETFRDETSKLIKYFLAALTIPEEEMWVNLSPYEKDRIIPEYFGQTKMGHDLLAQDYILKQMSSALMNPDMQPGAEFWARVQAKAEEQFGTKEIPLSTFNKIWIVPEYSHVYEHNKGAVMVGSKLKVMLEEDYLALEANKGRTNHGVGDINVGAQPRLRPNHSGEYMDSPVQGYQTQIMREIIIPEVEREVNVGKAFANLRQIYSAVILASWYKQALKESFLGKHYVDQRKTEGVHIDDVKVNQAIYQQYVDAFKKGAYNFIKEDYDPAAQQVIPRKYFTGGARLALGNKARVSRGAEAVASDLERVRDRTLSQGVVVTVQGDAGENFAMLIASTMPQFIIPDDYRERLKDVVVPGAKKFFAAMGTTLEMALTDDNYVLDVLQQNPAELRKTLVEFALSELVLIQRAVEGMAAERQDSASETFAGLIDRTVEELEAIISESFESDDLEDPFLADYYAGHVGGSIGRLIRIVRYAQTGELDVAMLKTDDEKLERAKTVLKTKKLLVVDDQDIVLETLVDMYREFFDDIVTAPDGVEGWEMLLSDEDIVAVSTDLTMLEMNGNALARKIRSELGARGQMMPIVTLTTEPKFAESGLFNAALNKIDVNGAALVFSSFFDPEDAAMLDGEDDNDSPDSIEEEIESLRRQLNDLIERDYAEPEEGLYESQGGPAMQKKLNQLREKRKAQAGDAAMLDKQINGGIDLNPAIDTMNIDRQSGGVQWSTFNQFIPGDNFNGITPVIINITPVTNLPFTLGFVNSSDDKENLSRL